MAKPPYDRKDPDAPPPGTFSQAENQDQAAHDEWLAKQTPEQIDQLASNLAALFRKKTGAGSDPED